MFSFKRTIGGMRAFDDRGNYICMTRRTPYQTYEAYGNNGSKFVVSRYGSTRERAVQEFLDAPVDV